MNLWKNLGKITTQIKNNPTKILMLDFDGTLTPIIQTPKEAKLPVETKNLLKQLCQKPNLYLAIISGRKLADIKKKIGLPNIIYGGNHGLEGEILHKRYSFPIPNKTLVILENIKKQLNKIADQFAGVFIENKGLTLSLHYRLARKQEIPTIRSLFKITLKPFTEDRLISVIPGKMVFDIRPLNDCNKGTFAKLLINKISEKTKTTPVVFFIGDDITDEDVFKELEKKITVKVGRNSESSAKYRLKDTRDVFKFLKWVAVNF